MKLLIVGARVLKIQAVQVHLINMDKVGIVET